MTPVVFVPLFGFVEYIIGLFVLLIVLMGMAAMLFARFFRRVDQGSSLVRNGWGGTRVSFSGMTIFPIVHQAEIMDISVKRIEIYRHGEEGLICRDNIRADIKVVFFVRVNKTVQDVMQVAQLLGCRRASTESALVDLFDAKFSEALKTVGKQFDFVNLYDSREKFKDEILKIIGTDLNGYVLDDAAIDYLEQTPVEKLNPDNILDAEGIKKITELTAQQQVLANHIRRDKEKVITKQDVETREAVLELQRQQAEAEEKQAREISEIRSRERAEAEVVGQQQRLRTEQARIATDEEIQIAEENKNRQVIVALKSKQRTEAVESERVEKDRMLEVTERDRVVTLAEIAKQKAVEQERKNIQDVIRDRVMVERAVVEEEEKIKDTKEFALATRLKQVAVTQAQTEAEQALVKQVKGAEAAKQAAQLHADQIVISAQAARDAAEREKEAKKLLAEAVTAEAAAGGLAEAQVMLAKAESLHRQGSVEAAILQASAEAEAKGLAAKAEATEKHGAAEATVLQLKLTAEAEGIVRKADAMKALDGVGRDHEEFKLRLNQAKEIELAAIEAQQKIASSQAEIVAQALKSANIDIVGGDSSFFERILGSITNGKAVDRFVHSSQVLTDVQQTLFNGNLDSLVDKVKHFVGRFGLTAEDTRNLTIAALIARMIPLADSDTVKQELQGLLALAQRAGISQSVPGNLKITAQHPSSP